MSQELERVYTINLGKVKISQSQHRAVRAINMIREFARHHMKVETIKIEEELSHEIWARGVRNPPRKVRVRMSKTEEGHILVSRYDEDAESKAIPETKKVSDKVEEPKTPEPAKETPKPTKTEEPKTPEPAKETPKPTKTEEPKTPEPAKETPKPTKTEEPKTPEPAKETPKPTKTEEPKTPEPAKETPKPTKTEEPKTPEPAKETPKKD